MHKGQMGWNAGTADSVLLRRHWEGNEPTKEKTSSHDWVLLGILCKERLWSGPCFHLMHESYTLATFPGSIPAPMLHAKPGHATTPTGSQPLLYSWVVERLEADPNRVSANGRNYLPQAVTFALEPIVAGSYAATCGPHLPTHGRQPLFPAAISQCDMACPPNPSQAKRQHPSPCDLISSGPEALRPPISLNFALVVKHTFATTSRSMVRRMCGNLVQTPVFKPTSIKPALAPRNC